MRQSPVCFIRGSPLQESFCWGEQITCNTLIEPCCQIFSSSFWCFFPINPPIQFLLLVRVQVMGADNSKPLLRLVTNYRSIPTHQGVPRPVKWQDAFSMSWISFGGSVGRHRKKTTSARPPVGPTTRRRNPNGTVWCGLGGKPGGGPAGLIPGCQSWMAAHFQCSNSSPTGAQYNFVCVLWTLSWKWLRNTDCQLKKETSKTNCENNKDTQPPLTSFLPEPT